MYGETRRNVIGGYTHTYSYMHDAYYSRLNMALSCDPSVLADSMTLRLHLPNAFRQRQSMLQLALGSPALYWASH